MIVTLVRGERAEANEWGAKTLEWTVPTPVPLENFEGELPVITSGFYDYGEPEPEEDKVAVGAPAQAQVQTEN